jgi:uncharacterized membrane protein
MHKRLLIASALASAVAGPVAATSAQVPKPAPMPEFKAEKCYGIARVGQNDCASTGNNDCAGTSTKANDLRAWISIFPRATAVGFKVAARRPSGRHAIFKAARAE